MINKPKVSWEGETVEPGIWYDKTLFSLGGFDFTGKGLIGSGVIAAISIGLCCCICCACSYWKRKKLVKLYTQSIGDKLR